MRDELDPGALEQTVEEQAEQLSRMAWELKSALKERENAVQKYNEADDRAKDIEKDWHQERTHWQDILLDFQDAIEVHKKVASAQESKARVMEQMFRDRGLIDKMHFEINAEPEPDEASAEGSGGGGKRRSGAQAELERLMGEMDKLNMSLSESEKENNVIRSQLEAVKNSIAAKIKDETDRLMADIMGLQSNLKEANEALSAKGKGNDKEVQRLQQEQQQQMKQLLEVQKAMKEKEEAATAAQKEAEALQSQVQKLETTQAKVRCGIMTTAEENGRSVSAQSLTHTLALSLYPQLSKEKEQSSDKVEAAAKETEQKLKAAETEASAKLAKQKAEYEQMVSQMKADVQKAQGEATTAVEKAAAQQAVEAGSFEKREAELVAQWEAKLEAQKHEYEVRLAEADKVAWSGVGVEASCQTEPEEPSYKTSPEDEELQRDMMARLEKLNATVEENEKKVRCIQLYINTIAVRPPPLPASTLTLATLTTTTHTPHEVYRHAKRVREGQG